jgi:uncharacterized membrane protein
VTSLGWLSVAVGAAEVVAPRVVARVVGVRAPRRVRGLIRVMGVRGLVAGIGLLSRGRAARWLQARVAGDLIDFGLLRRALRQPGARRGRTIGALVATWGLALLDARSARLAQHEALVLAAAPARRSRTIGRPPAEIFAFWRDFANLPGVIPHLDSVDVIDAQRSRWRARGGSGDELIEWETLVVEERWAEVIRWKSLDKSNVTTSGELLLAPTADGGTQVTLELRYHPASGALGRILESFWDETTRDEELDETLRRLEQLLESGTAFTRTGPSSASPR